MKRPRSIVGRLTLWYACSAFGLVLVSAVALYGALVANLNDEDEEFASDIVHIVRAFVRDRPADVDSLKRTIEWEWTGRRYAQIYVRLVDDSGRTVVETPGMPFAASLFPLPVAADAEPGEGVEIPLGAKPFRAIAARAQVGMDGRETRTVQVALGQDREQQLLVAYRRQLWLVLSLALIICTIGGHAIARRAVRPITDITEAAKRVRTSTLDSRIPTAGFSTELSALAETFNTMLARLEESFQRLSRFSGDIAHELRSPVNNIRGEAEVALRQSRNSQEYRVSLESVLEEAVRLTRTIDSLLFVARAEHPETEIARETLHVSRELQLVREFYEALATDRGVTLTVDAPEHLRVNFDRTLWQRAIGNLLDNATDHTPRGGGVAVRAALEGDALRVDVTDTGSGIPPEHLPHVFERFYRADQSRSGPSGRLGLGLAIVRSIVTLHGGSVSIASAVGRGTTVTLRIPADVAPAETARAS